MTMNMTTVKEILVVTWVGDDITSVVCDGA